MAYVKLALNEEMEVKINITEENRKEVFRDLAQLFTSLSYEDDIRNSKTFSMSNLFGQRTPQVEEEPKDSWSDYAKAYENVGGTRGTDTESRKILVITKCECCGTNIPLVGPESELLNRDFYRCKRCSSKFDLPEIKPAEYSCSCGNRSTLFITDNCQYIKCKKCDSDVVFEWNEDKEKYISINL